MADDLDVLLIAADKVWKAHGVFVANGGGAWKRHVEPAIYELRKVETRIRKRRLQGSTEVLLYMSGPAIGIAQGAYTNGPATSLEELQPDPDHVVVVKNARGDIINRFWAETGEIYK